MILFVVMIQSYLLELIDLKQYNFNIDRFLNKLLYKCILFQLEYLIVKNYDNLNGLDFVCENNNKKIFIYIIYIILLVILIYIFC